MKKILFFIVLSTLNSYSQDSNTFYTSFSSENPREHIIRFLNDSIAEFQNIPTHGSKIFSFKRKYFKENGILTIEIGNLTDVEQNNLKIYNLDYLENKRIYLAKNKKELVDKSNGTVYVDRKILNRNYIRRKSITIINSKKYIVDRGITNGYGLIEKLPKGNKNVAKFIMENAEDPKFKSEVIRGLKAYKKYGILGINGVCIITKTE
ncbi:hypothetical protein HNP37_000090 [Flavobacterium nitrogenifigens]|uniref:Uncharacterized protein n=2 Tax=Flavobacterium TaxID=237 RepID=A0A7W7IT54_9FLAO|nr:MULTISPECIES: hypothetical protein [Flavobacterium]MBB4800051.1 hypothetical protein [Flavobacterium nitrogenifigens]MBB6386199.1 hypothetical protein [Flavobacterium notoginsengisoli]